MHKTRFAGLTELDPTDPITVDGSSFLDENPSRIDAYLRIGAVTHRHDAHPQLPDPIRAPNAGAGAQTGGQFGADQDFWVGYSLVDGDDGETRMGPATHVVTPSGLAAPSAAIQATFDSTGGALPAGQYVYALTLNDVAGGESKLGPAAFVQRPAGFPSGQIQLSGLSRELDLNIATSNNWYASWNLWRAQDGGDFQVIATAQTGDTFTDTGLICTDAARVPPIDQSQISVQNALVFFLPSSVDNPPFASAEVAVASASAIRVYLSNDDTFSNPCLLATYPVASAGALVTVLSPAVQTGAPPAVSTASRGANQINPDTDILDWHWKRPVATPDYLPAIGNASADARVCLSPMAIFAWDGTKWDVVAAASGVGGHGGGGLIAMQDAFGGSAVESGFAIGGQGTTKVTVTDVPVIGSAGIVVETPPWTASAQGASATVGANPDGATGGQVQEVAFAGSGAAIVTLTRSGGSAVVLVTVPTSAGPAGASGAPGPAGASGAPGPAGASGAPGPAGASGAPGPTGPTGPQGSAANFVASAGDAQAIVGPFLGFAGSGGVSVELTQQSGSAVVVISASGLQGPQGPQGPQGTPGAAGAPGAGASVGVAGQGQQPLIDPTTYVEFLASGGAVVGVTDLGGGSARVSLTTTDTTPSFVVDDNVGGSALAGGAGALPIEFVGSGAASARVSSQGGSAVVTITVPQPLQGATGPEGPQGPQGPAGTGGGGGSIQVAGSAGVTPVNPASDVEFAGSGGVGVAVQSLGGGSARVLIGTSTSGGGGVIISASGSSTPSESTVIASGSAGVRTAVQDNGGGTGTLLIGMPTRDMLLCTTPTLASAVGSAGASATVYWPLGKTSVALQVQTDVPVRLRLYTTPAKRDSDAGRSIGTDPSPNSGCLLELVTSPGNLIYDLSPEVLLASQEGSSLGVMGGQSFIAGSVQNLGNVNGSINVHFVRYLLEA